jgi:diacylglycerol kinase family enzyme
MGVEAQRNLVCELAVRPILYVPDSARTVIIARNPKAGARDSQRNTAQLARALQDQGCDVRELTQIERLVDEATAAHRAGALRAVVSAGGDGTARLLADCLPPGLPLAILPLGTENLLAKHLQQAAQPNFVAARILRGATVRLDCGCANGRLFMLIAGCGFDAEVVRRVHQARTGHIHYGSYAKPILDAIRSYRYPELRLYCAPDGQPQEPCLTTPVWSGRWIFVSNLPRYAVGLSLTPQADGTDGLLDVCAFQAGSFWHGLRYLYGVAMRQHLGWSDVQTWQLRKLRIEADVDVPYQLDGDPGGELPLTVEVLPQRLTLVVDAAWATMNGFVDPRHSSETHDQVPISSPRQSSSLADHAQ